MKVTYRMETAWPSDVRAPRGVDGLYWKQDSEIPFLPVIGMSIDPTPEGADCYEVEDVYWMASEPDRIEVWLKSTRETSMPVDYHLAQGWTSDDLPRRQQRKPR